jgi:hypothetical protein
VAVDKALKFDAAQTRVRNLEKLFLELDEAVKGSVGATVSLRGGETLLPFEQATVMLEGIKGRLSVFEGTRDTLLATMRGVSSGASAAAAATDAASAAAAGMAGELGTVEERFAKIVARATDLSKLNRDGNINLKVIAADFGIPSTGDVAHQLQRFARSISDAYRAAFVDPEALLETLNKRIQSPVNLTARTGGIAAGEKFGRVTNIIKPAEIQEAMEGVAKITYSVDDLSKINLSKVIDNFRLLGDNTTYTKAQIEDLNTVIREFVKADTERLLGKGETLTKLTRDVLREAQYVKESGELDTVQLKKSFYAQAQQRRGHALTRELRDTVALQKTKDAAYTAERIHQEALAIAYDSMYTANGQSVEMYAARVEKALTGAVDPGRAAAGFFTNELLKSTAKIEAVARAAAGSLEGAFDTTEFNSAVERLRAMLGVEAPVIDIPVIPVVADPITPKTAITEELLSRSKALYKNLDAARKAFGTDSFAGLADSATAEFKVIINSLSRLRTEATKVGIETPEIKSFMARLSSRVTCG